MSKHGWPGYDFSHGASGLLASAAGSTLLNGLVSYWQLNELSGTRYDAVGDNDLTDNNTVGAVNRGPVGTVANFVFANSEYLQKASASFSAPDYCMTGWFKTPIQDGNFHELVFLGDAWLSTIILAVDIQSSGMRAFVTDDTTFASASTTGIKANSWHFFSVWYDSSDKKIRLSLDDGVAGVSDALAGPRDNATTVTIGSLTAPGGGQFMDGQIANVSLHSRVLTAEERTSLFNFGNGKKYADLTTAEKVGLVSYWNLDEASGTRVDSHGSNDLTDNNTVGSVINAGDAMDGAAAIFVSGNSESLSVTTPSALAANADKTLALWTKSPGVGTYALLQVAAGLGSSSPYLYLQHAGEALKAYAGGNYTDAVACSANTWHLVIYTYEHATTTHKLYVDAASATRVAANSNSSDSLYLGNGFAGYLTGSIDEVAIWNRVLTEDERTELYNAGAGKFYPF